MGLIESVVNGFCFGVGFWLAKYVLGRFAKVT